ncbi:peptidylprolyl isomerase [Urechidicola sp. KH5]
MAILSKLREKTVVVIGVIGLALFAFVIGDAVNKNGGGDIANVVGEVNGEEFSREAFNSQIEAYKANSGVTDRQAMNAVWDGFVRDQLFKEQLELAGVVVGEEDVWQSIISMPYFQNGPQFKNEIGLFDEEKVKEFIANMRDDAIGADKGSVEYLTWLNWLNTEQQIRESLIRSSYGDLVNAGLGASVEDGKRSYFYNNTGVNAQFVYVPYTSIADADVNLSNADYQNYINARANEFQVEEGRNLKYVHFKIEASEADKQAIRSDLESLKSGFATAEDNNEFIDIEKSDLALNDSYRFKTSLPVVVQNEVMAASQGDVVGPYEEAGYFKIAKVAEIKKMPDSVKASHILVTYLGARSASAETVQTEEQAKKTVDSILNVVKRSPSKFASLAQEFSVDQSNASNGGDLGWFNYTRMVPEFRDYSFENSKGDIGIVQTVFGYHIVKIDDQKNIQNTVKLAELSRQIDASAETEATIYQNAEIFASELVAGANIDEAAGEKNYIPSPANNIKALDDLVPGLPGNNRSIVRWAFEDITEKGAVKRFDVDGGYAVVVLDGKIKEGIAQYENITSQIKTKAINERKAELIEAKLSGATLEEIASANNVSVRTASNVTLASPTISGVGSEPAVVGAMSLAKVGELHKGIAGEKGVFVFKVSSKEVPTDLDNYNTFRTRLTADYKSRSSQLLESLKEASDIQDYRAVIY